MYGFIVRLQDCINNAMRMLSSDFESHIEFNDLEIKVWKQTWGDTSCGFGGFAGQSVTDAYTVVVLDRRKVECIVFHDMEFAYRANLTEDIIERIASQNLLGAIEFNKHK